MKYILAHTDDPISYHEQTQQTKHQSSHEYVIIEIKQRNFTPQRCKGFCSRCERFEKDRVEADYSERQFSLDESLTCRDQANRLISKLKRYFGDI